MTGYAREIAQRLAHNAEAVCRYYLPNGRRQGCYWLIGDATGGVGRSLFLRLNEPFAGSGAAGQWMDAATGQHGDLLDLIQLRLNLPSLKDAMSEAEVFLGDPHLKRETPTCTATPRCDRSASARALFRSAQPLRGTLAETYLLARGLSSFSDLEWLRYHPRCYYRESDDAPRETWPALIAAVTNADGLITGVHRTWLSRDGSSKAPLSTPRRALGSLSGHGVRFGTGRSLMAGEGIETVLSARECAPFMPAIAALSAGHLAGLVIPNGLQRLYVLQDNDPAGIGACASLITRASELSIEAHRLVPHGIDWNEDLCRLSRTAMRDHFDAQLAEPDRIAIARED